MKISDFDLLIVGAGPVGCVIAERAANELNWKSLIIEKRNHIAGNCYDHVHESGILIHDYGPHYFRTSNASLIEYLSQFTEWIPGNYIVKSKARGKLFSFPISLVTLEQFYGRSFTEEQARQHLENCREKIINPKNSEEFVLSRVGRDLYETFYLGYTLKQWGKHPRELDPSVCGRIPIRFNRNEFYVDAKYLVTPARGFTELFSRMIGHPNIEVSLNTDFRELREQGRPKRAAVYCGPIDEYFDCRLGKLAWRSLNFKFQSFNEEYLQPCVQINYPTAEVPYTRAVEIKHVTRQKHENTVISYEYSSATGDPYYPVPSSENASLYAQYAELAANETKTANVFFSGRLATYRYINTDEAIEGALKTFDQIRASVAP